MLVLSLFPMFIVAGIQGGCAGGDVHSIPHSAPCSDPTYKLTPAQLSTSLWAREVVETISGGEAPRQNTDDMDALYREAAVADRTLKEMTRRVAHGTGGGAVFPPGGGLKGRKRAEEKVQVELGGDASALMDIARSSIEYADVDQVYQALRFILRQGYEVVRVKDRALDPLPSGFWDIHLNLRMPNGHIVEMQLHLKEIRKYSINEGHQYYERIRDMEARAFRENRSLTPEERETIDRLNCEQRRFYQAAFQRGQKRGGAEHGEANPCIN